MKMKTITKFLGAGVVIASFVSLPSCHDDQALVGGHGVLKVSAKIKSEIVENKPASRANIDELSDKCLIHIYNNKGLVRRYLGLSTMPADGIKLVSDHYRINAWAGDSVSASFDHQYYKGHDEFDISAGQTTKISLECSIANVVVALAYDDELDDYMTDYKMTVSHDRGELVYEGRETRWGYFMMPSTDKDLAWKLEGTVAATGESYVREGKIANAAPATLYTINLNLPTPNDPVSGGFLTIEVDETPLEEFYHNIEIAAAPYIYGFNGLNLNEPLMAETGKVGRLSVVVAGSSALKNVTLSNDDLGQLVGDEENSFELIAQDEKYRKILETAGIYYSYEYDEVEDESWLKINFEEEFTNRLEAKEYQFRISATDANNKTTTTTLTINCEDAPVMPAEVNNNDVWATRATVSGTILKAVAANPGVVYRVKTSARAEGDWIQASEVKIEGNKYSAVLTGLQPGTTYEYTATADGYISSNIKTFSTEAAPQLPNASFEEWHSGKTSIDSKNLDLIFADGGSMFWDSGNHGSIKANTNVTEFSSDKKHSGNGCARLTSKFASIIGIGKLAAGNIFIGEYLGTDVTDGILGWGRPWTSRPTAVTMWVHYTPVAVSHQKDNPGGVKIGDMDTGKIYIAILDNSKRTDPKAADKPYPVIVNTKSQTFFDVNGDNVIAYGEIILDKATEGDQMVQVRIPLTYRSNKKASNIMMTASSSTYGDYFTGGEGSTLYIDDIQLEY